MQTDLTSITMRCCVCQEHLGLGEGRTPFCPACTPIEAVARVMHHADRCSERLFALWHPRGMSTWCPRCRFTPDSQSLMFRPRTAVAS
jgi:hypothetical protein